MKKKFSSTLGYKTPENPKDAFSQVRSWINNIGLDQATDIVSIWMRVPAKPVPYFLIKSHVRLWLKYLMGSTIVDVTAEFRVLWYSFSQAKHNLGAMFDCSEKTDPEPCVSDSSDTIAVAAPDSSKKEELLKSKQQSKEKQVSIDLFKDF